uniref:DNA replication licensing factor MCM5 n=1 Tax=Oryctolagus cuniculus TaxID=9986 RepID=A0A5F9DGW8_RABIT
MSGFDDPGVFYSDSFGGDPAADEGQARKSQLQRRFKEFLRQYRVGTDRTGFTFKYRDELKRHYNLGEYWIEVEMEDLASFDEDLADYLYKQPAEHLQLLEEAAKEVADEVTRPRPAGDEALQDIQVMLKSDASPSSVRSLKSDMMSHLVKIPGIIIAASAVRAKATRISIQCRSCRNTLNNIAMRPGLEGYALPRKCNTDQAGRPSCPLDPYFIMPDKCKCVDFQTLKLQELPDAVPHGEMPRHMQLYCDRYLCDKVVPGNRVTIMGIYSIKKFGLTSTRGRDRVGVGIRSSYIRVLGIQVDTDGSGRSFAGSVSPQEEEEFRRLAALPNVYEVISKSIAPSIFGGTDMKKAIACLLFGGSRKRLPDGLTRRGDINLLMLGDPGTAKSQLLKFVEKCSPIGMREDDRVAIHEAMEQQTISLAKAGITTTLNSRCSVLAAANSVFGRWDETKGEDNIDFMPTILSRFDMIFIVKDEHNEERDVMLAKHVITLHVSALTQTQAVEGEIDLAKLKKFIAYCRAKCGPRLSAEAAEKLKNRYIIMRSGARQHERDSARRSSIPITVRGGGLHQPGGPGDAEPHREAAQAPLCHRLAGVGAQHRAGLHQAEIPGARRAQGAAAHAAAGRDPAPPAAQGPLPPQVSPRLLLAAAGDVAVAAVTTVAAIAAAATPPPPSPPPAAASGSSGQCAFGICWVNKVLCAWASGLLLHVVAHPGLPRGLPDRPWSSAPRFLGLGLSRGGVGAG